MFAPLEAAAQQRDPAAAQALFDQARALTQKGQYADACPKLLESNRLDPGIGTQFHLADCYEKNGQIATAWATFLDVASLARSTNQLDREKAATKRANLLEARLPRLTVNVPEASQAAGLVIRRGQVQVGNAQWGVPVPVDPGEHEILVSAPGRKSSSQTLKLEVGKTASFDVPALDVERATESALPPATVPQSAARPSVAPAPAPEPAPMAKSGVNAWPVVLAAAGVVGLGVGTVFGLKAQSSNKDSKKSCDAANPNLCDSAGVERNDARSQGNVATVSFIAGGALLAAATIVWRVEVGSSKKAALGRSPVARERQCVAGLGGPLSPGGFLMSRALGLLLVAVGAWLSLGALSGCNAVLDIEEAQERTSGGTSKAGSTGLGSSGPTASNSCTDPVSSSCSDCVADNCSTNDQLTCKDSATCRSALLAYSDCLGSDCKETQQGDCFEPFGASVPTCFRTCAKACATSPVFSDCEVLCGCMETNCSGTFTSTTACMSDVRDVLCQEPTGHPLSHLALRNRAVLSGRIDRSLRAREGRRTVRRLGQDCAGRRLRQQVPEQLRLHGQDSVLQRQLRRPMCARRPEEANDRSRAASRPASIPFRARSARRSTAGS